MSNKFFLLLISIISIYFPSLGQLPAPSNGLLAYFPMDAGADTIVTDASNNGYTGKFVNSPSWSTTGRVDKCVEMIDNSGRRIVVPSLTWTPTAFTVSFWLNPYSLVNYNQQIYSSIGWGGFMFYSASNGGITVGTNANTYLYSGPGTLVVNSWQHFTFSYAGGIGKLYKNGQLIGSRTGMSAPIAWGGFTIGGSGATTAIHGKVDEVRIYNRALTDEEVATRAAWPHGPLISIWKTTPQNTDWGTGANWTGGNVPVAASQVTVNSCTVCPTLNADVTITRLALNANSSIHLNTFSLYTNSVYFNTATIYSENGTIKTPRVEDIRFCNFYGKAGSTHSSITIDVAPEGLGTVAGGNTYNLPIHYKWSRGWDTFYVGAHNAETYNDKATFTNYGGGWMSVTTNARGTVFKKKVEFINYSGRALGVADNGSVQFNDTVIFTNQAWNMGIANKVGSSATFLGPVIVNCLNSNIGFSFAGNTTFHKAITLSNSNTHYSGGIGFGENGGTTTLLEQASLQIKNWSLGNLTLYNFKQTNENTPTVLTLPKLDFTDPLLRIGQNSSFKGEVYLTAANIQLNGATFHKKAVFEKTSGNAYSTANSLGGNLFHGETVIRNTGGNLWYFGQNAPDTFNGDLSVMHSGGNGTYLAHWNVGHTFKGNISLSMSSGTGSIQFGAAGGTSELVKDETGNGKLLTANFSSGELKLFNFHQAGSQSPKFTFTSTSGLTLGTNSIFEAPVKAVAPQLFVNGSTFLQPSSFYKTGTGINNWQGGNTFKEKVTIRAVSGSIKVAVVNNNLVN